MFEPRSYLQKLADPWVYPQYLDRAAATSNPVERLKLVTAWCVAARKPACRHVCQLIRIERSTCVCSVCTAVYAHALLLYAAAARFGAAPTATQFQRWLASLNNSHPYRQLHSTLARQLLPGFGGSICDCRNNSDVAPAFRQPPSFVCVYSRVSQGLQACTSPHPLPLDMCLQCPPGRFVAGLHLIFAGWRKPFNPLLGETWQVSRCRAWACFVARLRHVPGLPLTL